MKTLSALKARRRPGRAHPSPNRESEPRASPEPEYIQIVDITKTVTEPLNPINDTPRACRSSATTSNDPGQTGSLRVSTAAGALMASPISARTTPTTNAITATPKATTDVNSEDCRNAESIAVARFGSSRASSA